MPAHQVPCWTGRGTRAPRARRGCLQGDRQVRERSDTRESVRWASRADGGWLASREGVVAASPGVAAIPAPLPGAGQPGGRLARGPGPEPGARHTGGQQPLPPPSRVGVSQGQRVQEGSTSESPPSWPARRRGRGALLEEQSLEPGLPGGAACSGVGVLRCHSHHPLGAQGSEQTPAHPAPSLSSAASRAASIPHP